LKLTLVNIAVFMAIYTLMVITELIIISHHGLYLVETPILIPFSPMKKVVNSTLHPLL